MICIFIERVRYLKINGPDLWKVDNNALKFGTLSNTWNALERLGDPCREIIELRYFGDLSYEEISQSLRLNPKTVSSRLSKCLDRLEEIARKVFSGEKSGAFPSNL